MSGWIESLNWPSAAWAPWLWRACWQGAIVIAIAWLLTLALRNWSPRIRSWIWRIAYLKLLLLLVWTGAIELPILRPEGTGGGAQGAVGQSISEPGHTPERAAPPTDHLAIVPKDVEPAPAILPAPAEPTIERSPATSVTFNWTAILAIVWLGGAMAILIALILDAARVIRLAHWARPIEDPEREKLLADVCRQMNMKPRMQIRASQSVRGPMLVRFVRPAILLPSAMLANLNHDEIRLILAHELAHIKRRDLAWNALAAPVHVLLYFHPLVWLAHRCARQEQEMACDELVITRLNIERQAYGETLIKVIKQIGCGFRGGALAVGMSASHKTLARRLRAMKDFRHYLNWQIAIAASTMGLMAALVVVPWRVVGQETAKTIQVQPNAPGKGESDATAKSAPTSDLKESSPEAKLLVGTWRAASGKDVVFFSDGSYEDFGVNIFYYEFDAKDDKGVETHHVSNERGQGSWSVEDQRLTLTQDDKARFWGPIAGGKTPKPRRRPSEFRVLKLNDSYLRLRYSGGGSLFFHRVIEQPADERLASVPQELRQLFNSAQFTPAEAASLLDLLKSNGIGIEPLQRMAGLVEVRRRKTTLPQLFGMDEKEVAAFRELLKQFERGQYDYLSTLATAGQLEPMELKAFEKIKPFEQAFEMLATKIPIDEDAYNTLTRSQIGNFRPNLLRARFREPSLTLDNDQRAAVIKLYSFLSELYQWFHQTAFAVPRD
jgi:beta-lactamase regulating signal transducer with metallopeptidase domain